MTKLLSMAIVLSLLAVPVHAAEFFRADLVPSPNSGSTATGVASLILDAQSGEVTYEISVSGLTSPEIAAHFHRSDGELLHQLPLGATKNGVWSGLGPADIFMLRDGQLFVLVHTELNPGGEVRGDIFEGRVPVEAGSVSRIKGRFIGPLQ